MAMACFWAGAPDSTLQPTGPDAILRGVADRGAILDVGLIRVDDGASWEPATDAVAVEAALEVRLNGQPFSVTMRTPGADCELAAGFLFTEGIVTAAADVLAVHVDPLAGIVDVILTADRAARVAAQRDARRQVTTTSSCGMCGRPDLASTRLTAPRVAPTRPVTAAAIRDLPARLAPLQETFAATGGLHAAALCTLDGDIVDTAEDVGRHNAVDKIIGRRLLAGRLPAGDRCCSSAAAPRSRSCRRRGWPASRSSPRCRRPRAWPSSWPRRPGITLIGFVRGSRFNIYTHPSRVAQAAVSHG